MRRLSRRFALCLLVVAVSGPAPSASAGAWGGDGGGVIGVGVDTGGGTGGSTGGGSTGHGGSGSSPWSCQYMYLALNNDGGFPPGGPEPGAWYSVTCWNSVTGASLTQTVWVQPTTSPPTTTPVVAAVSVAQQAENSMRLPSPTIDSSPAGVTYVNLPTWLWIDARIWHPLSVTASIGAVSATATAVPVSVRWSTGDGSTQTCSGPGTPYSQAAASAAQASSCVHAYRAVSRSAIVTATIEWDVTWTAVGVSGGGRLAPLTTTSSTNLAVGQIESVNVDSGGVGQ